GFYNSYGVSYKSSVLNWTRFTTTR
ncbi:hypothetical protein BMETH_15915676412387, partial [methanotrophic bacterial endosymbiont of Bathymodiolus sp.]